MLGVGEGVGVGVACGELVGIEVGVTDIEAVGLGVDEEVMGIVVLDVGVVVDVGEKETMVKGVEAAIFWHPISKQARRL